MANENLIWPVVDYAGNKVGEVTLPADLFNAEINEVVVQRAVRVDLLTAELTLLTPSPATSFMVPTASRSVRKELVEQELVPPILLSGDTAVLSTLLMVNRTMSSR